MKKYNSWMTALLSLLFIAIPALVIYYFFLPDWTGVALNNTWLLGIGFGFLGYGFVVGIFLVLVRVINLHALNFIIPITIVFFIIFVTTYLNIWIRVAMVLGAILLTFPINMATTKIANILYKKDLKKHKNG